MISDLTERAIAHARGGAEGRDDGRDDARYEKSPNTVVFGESFFLFLREIRTYTAHGPLIKSFSLLAMLFGMKSNV